ncbi:MAG TPA: ABC transporter substrate-binding protein [Steroidobacteraceae bacterium]|nr:ABC transporter substrate-binding protein [Steroidobacteraceae bacterium]
MSDAAENPLLSVLTGQLRGGLIDRREFIRCATLLGAAAASAYAIAGLAAPAMAGSTLPFPAADPGARRGGTLRVAQMVGRMEDPATYSWTEMANQTRPILEYLTMLGPDNIVRPMLIESWAPSADLKTWTLKVRPGVMWHNGEPLTAEHVAWNIRRWADPSLGSSNLGLSTFTALTELTGKRDAKGRALRVPRTDAVEVLDRETVRLHLAQPVLSVAEDCAEYSTLIAHPSFTPPWSRQPIGTGPYTLAELRVADRCLLKRITRTTDGKDFHYWGGDVYLDEIHFYHFEQENQTAALASGDVDAIYELTVEQLELARSIPNARISSVETAQTLCCRMQVDVKPFDDIRVRRAVVKAADNAAIKRLVFGEHGTVAANFHVAPIHPEYFPLPPAVRDVAGARQLLEEAGYGEGLQLTIVVGNNDGPWQQAACEALRDQVKEAGIHLAIDVVPATKYWEVWDKVPFGATSWSHRPLGTMALAEAYRSGASWNETHFADPQFDRALADAEATFDVTARKAKMQRVEEILRDAALMVQPFWRPVFILASSQVHGYHAHPGRQMQLTKVWMG